MRLLIVEDDRKTADYIVRGLTEAGHLCNCFADGRDGLFAATRDKFDVIVADRMIPGLDGLSMVEAARAAGVKTPVLFLASVGGIDDRVEGLEAGGDDYLVKPFAFSELLARINALYRRKMHFKPEPVKLAFADLSLDINTKIATREGRQIVLTAKEYALLELFMKNCNKVLSRIYIAQTIWGLDFGSSTNIIDVYINYLRNKIEKGFSGGKLIHTVIGMGYVMKMK